MAARTLTRREIPAGVVHRGEFQGARRWTDRTGDNIVLLTRTREVVVERGEQDPAKSREIYAYHYVRQSAGWRLLWQTRDYVSGCEFDLVLHFAPGSLRVTDVDRDGIAETSYVYFATCTSDVSPSSLKVILHEGAAKYGIRGTTDLRPLDRAYPAPEKQVDPALARLPALRALAERQWRRYVRQTTFEEGGPP